MGFIKKHYEKILLSIVLLGLAIAAALLPLKVSSVRTDLEDSLLDATRRAKPKVFKPIDLSTNQVVITRSLEPKSFNFGAPHNIFNPVEWRKDPDRGLVKIETGTEAGPGAFIIERIVPLYLTISLVNVSGSGGDFRYQFSIETQTERNPSRVVVASPMVENEYLYITEVVGPPDAPTAVKMRTNTGTAVSVSKDQPFSQVIGYAAEMRYPSENARAKLYKKDDPVRVPRDPERYKVVAITKDEVSLSADSTKKRTTLKWKHAPEK